MSSRSSPSCFNSASTGQDRRLSGVAVARHGERGTAQLLRHEARHGDVQEAHELKMIVAAVPLLASGPGVAEEFQLRLRSVRLGDTTVRWTAFGDPPR